MKYRTPTPTTFTTIPMSSSPPRGSICRGGRWSSRTPSTRVRPTDSEERRVLARIWKIECSMKIMENLSFVQAQFLLLK